jgi:hypothetical protein
LVRRELTELGAGRSAFSVAAVVASLLSAPRFRRSPPACPRTVRLRRYRSSQDSLPARSRARKRARGSKMPATGELLGAFSADAFGGQECPLHTGFAASPLAAPRVQALPARLPANCAASSLSLLAGQFARGDGATKTSSGIEDAGIGGSCWVRFQVTRLADRSVRPTRASWLRPLLRPAGSGASRPLACELCGFVAIAPRRAVRPRGWSNKTSSGIEDAGIGGSCWVRFQLTRLADRSVRPTRASWLRPLLRRGFRRFPTACPRTVRLRRYRSSRDSSPNLGFVGNGECA